jgi:hypothetical protein
LTSSSTQSTGLRELRISGDPKQYEQRRFVDVAPRGHGKRIAWAVNCPIDEARYTLSFQSLIWFKRVLCSVGAPVCYKHIVAPKGVDPVEVALLLIFY